MNSIVFIGTTNNTEPCPICNNSGLSVKKITVEHLVSENLRTTVAGDHYQICMNADCDVVYFNNAESIIFSKNQIKMPIWFKKDANPKYACYCSQVTEDQVIDAVLNQGAKTVKEVNAVTGAMKHANCIENNPLGICCHKAIQDAIDKGLGLRG